MTAEAQRELDKLLLLSKERYVPGYYLAAIYSGPNEKDLAFEMLEKAIEPRSGLGN